MGAGGEGATAVRPNGGEKERNMRGGGKVEEDVNEIVRRKLEYVRRSVCLRDRLFDCSFVCFIDSLFNRLIGLLLYGEI